MAIGCYNRATESPIQFPYLFVTESPIQSRIYDQIQTCNLTVVSSFHSTCFKAKSTIGCELSCRILSNRIVPPIVYLYLLLNSLWTYRLMIDVFPKQSVKNQKCQGKFGESLELTISYESAMNYSLIESPIQSPYKSIEPSIKSHNFELIVHKFRVHWIIVPLNLHLSEKTTNFTRCSIESTK
jgi:hypothetical protein